MPPKKSTSKDQIWAPQRGSQYAFHTSPAFELLFGGAAGGGKALNINELIPTPTGFKFVKDLLPGDLIFSELGKPIQILETHPIRFEQEVYRLEFDDGSEVVANSEHLWLTFDHAELAALTRRSDSFRTSRRLKRLSRATWKKGKYFTESLISRNHDLRPVTLPPPLGSVRSTRQIFETLKFKGRSNHAIPVSQALDLPQISLPIDPYLLGLWLGDGTSQSGSIGMLESDISELLPFVNIPVLSSKLISYQPNRLPFLIVRFEGLTSLLRLNNLQGNKHIPDIYLRSSKDQRLALLKGLMDTDGTVYSSGSVEFTNTNERIIDGIYELIVSLGWKVRKNEGRAVCNGKDCGPKWDLKWTPDEYVFNLPRKKSKQKLSTRRTTKFRYIVNCQRCEPQLMRCITVDNPTGLFLAGKSMIVTHNSDSLLIEAMRQADIPGYKAILFRRTYPELAKSLVPRAYDLLYGKAKPRNKGLEWEFPNGSVIYLSHLQREEDKQKYKSAEFDYIGFDELTSFSETQYIYLFSRCRGTNPNIARYIRSATNPTGIGNAWVKRRFIEPDPSEVEVSEEVEYEYARGWRVNTRVFTSFSNLPDNFQEGSPAFYPEKYTVWKEKKSGITRAFIPALMWGNEKLIKADPEYVKRMLALSEKEQKALLYGHWDVFEGQFFSEWDPAVNVVEPFEIPESWRRFVGIDYGYTSPMCALWFAVDEDGKIYGYRELYGRKMTPQEQAKHIRNMSEDERIEWMAADPSMFSRGSGYGESHSDIYSRHNVHLLASNNDRLAGWSLMHEMLASGQLVFFPNCANLIRTIPSLIHSKYRPEDLDTLQEDHAVDAVRYALLTFKGYKSHGKKFTEDGEVIPDWWDEVKTKIKRKSTLVPIKL